MIAYLRQLLKPKYPTLNRLEISAEAIKYNLEFLRAQQPNAKMIPVVKSNAYGHGLKEICIILSRLGVEMVALDSFPEAQIAYRYFKGRVLLLGEMQIPTYRHLDWSRTEICVYNEETLSALAALGVRPKVHLFINTGMNREGIKDLPLFWDKHSQLLSKVDINGLCSHLADGEGDGTFNDKQLKIFFESHDYLLSQGVSPKWVHLGNSAGVFALKDERLNAYRPGLALYGYNPFSSESVHYEEAKKLQPALRLLSTVVAVQKIQPGEAVSYNAAYRSQHDTSIAVIPFGYYEGLDRRLSNLADFYLIKDKKKIPLKLAGKVCMNLSCLDAGGEASVTPGDTVVLISTDKADANSLENLAKLQGTIPYEILVKFQANIRRNIV
ncbi:MAG: alanine racemase [bacterium]|nr:alanine racemase [bacterium]